ncbi:hypothetical protein JL722_8260 [Aureococcus anophagefferens]|nr:hypothetical protein JL722_8260 [Aureococcus anophagefferens]
MDLAARKRAWTGSVARPGDVAVLSNCEDDDSRRWVVDAALGASGASGVVTRLAYAAAGLALDALPADGDAAPPALRGALRRHELYDRCAFAERAPYAARARACPARGPLAGALRAATARSASPLALGAFLAFESLAELLEALARAGLVRALGAALEGVGPRSSVRLAALDAVPETVPPKATRGSSRRRRRRGGPAVDGGLDDLDVPDELASVRDRAVADRHVARAPELVADDAVDDDAVAAWYGARARAMDAEAGAAAHAEHVCAIARDALGAAALALRPLHRDAWHLARLLHEGALRDELQSLAAWEARSRRSKLEEAARFVERSGGGRHASEAAALRSLLGPFAVDDRGDFGVALAACRASAHTIPVPERLAPSQTRLAVFVLDVAAKAFDGGNDVNLCGDLLACLTFDDHERLADDDAAFAEARGPGVWALVDDLRAKVDVCRALRGDLKLFLPLRKLRDAAPRLDDADLDALAAPSDDLGVVDRLGAAGLWRARDASAALDAGRCAYVAKLALRGGDGGAVAPPPGAEDRAAAARGGVRRGRAGSSAAAPRGRRGRRRRGPRRLWRGGARAARRARTFDEGFGGRRRRRGATTRGRRGLGRGRGDGARRAARGARPRPRGGGRGRGRRRGLRAARRRRRWRRGAGGAPARSRRRSSRRRPSPTSATTTPGASSRPSSTTRTRTFSRTWRSSATRGDGGVGGDALVVRAARLAAETTTGSGAVAAAAAARLALFRRAAPTATAPARRGTRRGSRAGRLDAGCRGDGAGDAAAVRCRDVVCDLALDAATEALGAGFGGEALAVAAAQLTAGAKAMALFDAAGAFLGAPRPAGDAADRARDEIFRAADAPDALERRAARRSRASDARLRKASPASLARRHLDHFFDAPRAGGNVDALASLLLPARAPAAEDAVACAPAGGDPPATSAYAALLVLKESDDDGDDDRPEAGGAWLPPPPGAVLLKYLKGRYRKESDARPLDLLCRLVVAHCGQADATFCRVAQEHGLLLRRFARATKALGRSEEKRRDAALASLRAIATKDTAPLLARIAAKFAGAVSPAEVYACAARREAFHALEGDAGDLERAAAERAAPLFARGDDGRRRAARAAFFENFGGESLEPLGRLAAGLAGRVGAPLEPRLRSIRSSLEALGLAAGVKALFADLLAAALAGPPGDLRKKARLLWSLLDLAHAREPPGDEDERRRADRRGASSAAEAVAALRGVDLSAPRAPGRRRDARRRGDARAAAGGRPDRVGEARLYAALPPGAARFKAGLRAAHASVRWAARDLAAAWAAAPAPAATSATTCCGAARRSRPWTPAATAACTRRSPRRPRRRRRRSSSRPFKVACVVLAAAARRHHGDFLAVARAAHAFAGTPPHLATTRAGLALAARLLDDGRPGARGWDAWPELRDAAAAALAAYADPAG